MYLAYVQSEKQDYESKRKKLIQEELDLEKRKCTEKENLINDLVSNFTNDCSICFFLYGKIIKRNF